MKIRSAEVSDIESIANIHANSWLESYDGILDVDYLEKDLKQERLLAWESSIKTPKMNQRTLIAEVGGDVIGFISVLIDEDPALGSYIDNLHVSKASQSQGMGRALLKEAACLCRKTATSSSMYLLVTQHNMGAQRFYTKLGASNKESLTWEAPEGSKVQTYKLVWKDIEVILSA